MKIKNRKELYEILNSDNAKKVYPAIKKMLINDLEKFNKGENVSILAVWLPSCNAHSEMSKKCSKDLCRYLNMSERKYRKTLSKLRNSYYTTLAEKRKARKIKC